MTKQENAKMHYNQSSGVLNRRTKALLRLQEQLKSGIKVTTDYDPDIKGYLTMSLSDKDEIRIKKEIAVLSAKI